MERTLGLHPTTTARVGLSIRASAQEDYKKFSAKKDDNQKKTKLHYQENTRMIIRNFRSYHREGVVEKERKTQLGCKSKRRIFSGGA